MFRSTKRPPSVIAPGFYGERETGLRAPALRIHLEQVDGFSDVI